MKIKLSRDTQEWKLSTFLNVISKFCHGCCIQVLWRYGNSWDFNSTFNEINRNNTEISQTILELHFKRESNIYVPDHFPGFKDYFTG